MSDDDILRAARESFGEQGLRVSMEAVATQLHISAAAIFKRYGSKERLFLEAMVSEPPSTLWPWKELASGPAGSDIETELVTLLTHIFIHMRQVAPILRSFWASGINLDDPAVMHMPNPAQAAHSLSLWLERSVAAGHLYCENCKTTSSIILGTLNFAVMHIAYPFDVGESPIEDDFIPGMVRSLMRGMMVNKV